MHSHLYEDPVVAEIHAAREKMLADCDGDHQRLMRHVREHQKASVRKVILAPSSKQSAEQIVGPDGEHYAS